jgi:hypothetical protein
MKLKRHRQTAQESCVCISYKPSHISAYFATETTNSYMDNTEWPVGTHPHPFGNKTVIPAPVILSVLMCLPQSLLNCMLPHTMLKVVPVTKHNWTRRSELVQTRHMSARKDGVVRGAGPVVEQLWQYNPLERKSGNIQPVTVHGHRGQPIWCKFHKHWGMRMQHVVTTGTRMEFYCWKSGFCSDKITR